MMEEEWRLDAGAMTQFTKMFTDACAVQGSGVDRLGKAEAGAVLSLSGLPVPTLLQIWGLADVDGDDQLDLKEYLLCCWLVQRSVQKQLPPPTSLPPELLASATGAVAPPTELPSVMSLSMDPQPTLAAAPVEDGFGFDDGEFGDAEFGDGFSDAPARGFGDDNSGLGDDNSGLGDDNGGFCGDNGGLGDGGARTCGSTP